MALIGEARSAGHEHQRLLIVFAQEERAERAFHAQDLAQFHLRLAGAEHMVGEYPARRMAYVQLDQVVFAGRRGHRIAAPAAILQDELDVLPGVVAEGIRRGQLQLDDHDVAGRLLQAHDARRHLADLDVAGHADFMRFYRQVGTGPGLAEEGIALLQVFGREDLRGARAGVVRPGNDPALAGGTRAVAATVRQDDARRQGAVQYGLPLFDGELVLAGLNCDLETHDAR